MYYKKQGFTLIELLVVISIIGLLSTLAVVAFGNARMKSRDTKRVSDIKSIQTGLELYYGDKDAYPIKTTAVILGTAGFETLSSTNGFSATAAGTTYMTVPKDPTSTGDYKYSYSTDTDGTTYAVAFKTEQKNVSGLTQDTQTHSASPAGMQ